MTQSTTGRLTLENAQPRAALPQHLCGIRVGLSHGSGQPAAEIADIRGHPSSGGAHSGPAARPVVPDGPDQGSLLTYIRSVLKPARTSSVKAFGCSQAAKCPPLGSLL